jgi:hypothetical protein
LTFTAKNRQKESGRGWKQAFISLNLHRKSLRPHGTHFLKQII